MTMDLESIRDVVTPVVVALGLDLYDVELTASGRARVLRVVVDREGGVDLDTITEVTRALAPALSASAVLRDSDVLEVSSPGLERPLRRPEHYQAAVGALVSVKYLRDGETVRERGTLAAADDLGIQLTAEGEGAPTTSIPYADITACRTIFEWGPAPRPGRGSKPGKHSARRPKETSRS
jgi:ribosome maturation factor RimP